jgi:hypothetical protein
MEREFVLEILLKGDKLSGMLEGVIFKITICDEGTIDFEEVDTNISDKAMRQRLIDDIDSNDVTGYTQSLLSQILNLMILMDLDVI